MANQWEKDSEGYYLNTSPSYSPSPEVIDITSPPTSPERISPPSLDNSPPTTPKKRKNVFGKMPPKKTARMSTGGPSAAAYAVKQNAARKIFLWYKNWQSIAVMKRAYIHKLMVIVNKIQVQLNKYEQHGWEIEYSPAIESHVFYNVPIFDLTTETVQGGYLDHMSGLHLDKLHSDKEKSEKTPKAYTNIIEKITKFGNLDTTQDEPEILQILSTADDWNVFLLWEKYSQERNELKFLIRKYETIVKINDILYYQLIWLYNFLKL